MAEQHPQVPLREIHKEVQLTRSARTCQLSSINVCKFNSERKHINPKSTSTKCVWLKTTNRNRFWWQLRNQREACSVRIYHHWKYTRKQLQSAQCLQSNSWLWPTRNALLIMLKRRRTKLQFYQIRIEHIKWTNNLTSIQQSSFATSPLYRTFMVKWSL